MTRAEAQAMSMVEEAGREVARTFKPRPYTLEERAMKRLVDSLDTLDRSREMPPEHGSEDPS
jgi:hypothetical protein